MSTSAAQSVKPTGTQASLNAASKASLGKSPRKPANRSENAIDSNPPPTNQHVQRKRSFAQVQNEAQSESAVKKQQDLRSKDDPELDDNDSRRKRKRPLLQDKTVTGQTSGQNQVAQGYESDTEDEDEKSSVGDEEANASVSHQDDTESVQTEENSLIDAPADANDNESEKASVVPSKSQQQSARELDQMLVRMERVARRFDRLKNMYVMEKLREEQLALQNDLKVHTLAAPAEEKQQLLDDLMDLQKELFESSQDKNSQHFQASPGTCVHDSPTTTPPQDGQVPLSLSPEDVKALIAAEIRQSSMTFLNATGRRRMVKLLTSYLYPESDPSEGHKLGDVYVPKDKMTRSILLKRFTVDSLVAPSKQQQQTQSRSRRNPNSSEVHTPSQSITPSNEITPAASPTGNQSSSEQITNMNDDPIKELATIGIPSMLLIPLSKQRVTAAMLSSTTTANPYGNGRRYGRPMNNPRLSGLSEHEIDSDYFAMMYGLRAGASDGASNYPIRRTRGQK